MDFTQLLIKDDNMTYILIQTALLTTAALISGAAIGWWLNSYYGKEKREIASNDYTTVKNYLAESIRENARLKIQLKSSEEKIQLLSENSTPKIDGVDFEAYQAFENTVKAAKMRKYLN